MIEQFKNFPPQLQQKYAYYDKYVFYGGTGYSSKKETQSV